MYPLLLCREALIYVHLSTKIGHKIKKLDKENELLYKTT